MPVVLVEIIKVLPLRDWRPGHKLDRELLDGIEVRKQGYTLALSLFNCYACVMEKWWLEKVRGG